MNDYLASIDLGSSTTRVIVARTEKGILDIVGVGSTPSKGIKNGNVLNIESAAASILEALRQAELMSGVAVEEAVLNITGKHMRGENSTGVVAIAGKDRVVSENDVLRVVEGAQNIRIPADQTILHVLPREFAVDDQKGVRDPIGMTGVRLESEVHVVLAGVTAISNMKKAVSQAGIHVSAMVMNSLASAQATLGQGEKDLGVVSIDIGGGIADIVIYIEGGVAFSSVVPIGGIHVTQDLSIGLKIPLENAEVVKKTYGSCLIAEVDPTERIEVALGPGRQPKRILRSEVAEVIEPRMREILELIDREITRSGFKSEIGGGAVLSGGAVQLEGTANLAEEVLQLPVSLSLPRDITGFVDRVNGPDFATGLGLLQYAMHSGVQDVSPREKSDSPLRRIKSWIEENF